MVQTQLVGSLIAALGVGMSLWAIGHALLCKRRPQSAFGWITMAAQMGMGFVLPFALIFVAIPLETFVQSSRNVFGAAAAGFLRAFAFTLRLLGNMCRHGGHVLVEAYDVLIFGPLWLETTIKSRTVDKGSRPVTGGQQ